MKRVAIIQSNYIPWKGYFDLINMVDEFILYDDAQYTKRDWRNRNLIKTPGGTTWLSIPVKVKGQYRQKIRDTEVNDGNWAEKHWKAITLNYSRAQHFNDLAPALSDLYRICAKETSLSIINYLFIENITKILGINTKITWSMDYHLKGDRVERLVNLCKQAEADQYISGPAARCYLDEERFEREGIAVKWMDYSGYPEYTQLFMPPFVHGVTILDLLLNEGTHEARKKMLSF